MKVLVLGGSGFVGRALLRSSCSAKGISATVPTRRARATRASSGRTARPCTVVRWRCARTMRACSRRLLPGHDAVVNLIAVLHGQRGATSNALHVQWPHRLGARLRGRRAMPRNSLHVSALGVEASDASGSRLSAFSKARGETHACRRSRVCLPLTVLRPSVVFGAARQAAQPLRRRCRRFSRCMPLAGARSALPARLG